MTKVREYDRFEDFARDWMEFPLPDLIKVFIDDAEVRKVLREVVGASEFDALERELWERIRACDALDRCQHCGQMFQPARSDAKFCSTRCRVANHRKVNCA
jgi:hypothetical protein